MIQQVFEVSLAVVINFEDSVSPGLRKDWRYIILLEFGTNNNLSN